MMTRQVVRSSDPSNALHLVVLGVGLIVLCGEVIDLVTALNVSVASDATRPSLMALLPYLSISLYGSVAFWLARNGAQGIYAMIVGCLISLFLLYNFRSYYIRFNTFDLFEDSRSGWMTSWMIGACAGAVIGSVVNLLRGRKSPIDTGWVVPIAIAAWACLVWFMAGTLVAATWSDFPQTRQFALFGVSTILAALVFLAGHWRRNNFDLLKETER